MCDPALTDAINVAGSTTTLVKRVGISQPTISYCDRAPPERVLAVEVATGVSRVLLPSDLYSEAFLESVDEVDAARAQEYSLLATLMSRAPNGELLKRLSRLCGDATPLGVVHAALGQAAADIDTRRVEHEFFDLFIGLGRGQLLPYASYYLTGFLHERPLARLRDDLARIGIERVEGNHEPEDHAATLCEIMASLASGRFPAPADAQREIFGKHMQPWIGRFFIDVERVAASDFYRRVGQLGRLFIEIETKAFSFAQ